MIYFKSLCWRQCSNRIFWNGRRKTLEHILEIIKFSDTKRLIYLNCCKSIWRIKNKIKNKNRKRICWRCVAGNAKISISHGGGEIIGEWRKWKISNCSCWRYWASNFVGGNFTWGCLGLVWIKFKRMLMDKEYLKYKIWISGRISSG